MTERDKNLTLKQKLLLARTIFANKNVKKTGINRHAEFKYYELEDIVPIANGIFSDLGLLFCISFSDTEAIGTLSDVQSAEEMQFKAPLTFIQEPAKFRMNEVQATGATITYFRRYLYFLLFDIVEADVIDDDKLPTNSTNLSIQNNNSVVVAQKPLSNEARKELKAEITQAEAQADELQIKSLKKAMKKLKAEKPEKVQFNKDLLEKTEKLTKLSKSDCENYLKQIAEILKGE